MFTQRMSDRLKILRMQNRTLGRLSITSGSLFAYATSIALGVASLLIATWLWCCWCSFPANPWNDLRVAPAVAWHHGISIYSSAADGPVSTWIYGPLPLLLMWPAGLATSAAGALQIAGAIHITLTVAALTFTCMLWPASPQAKSKPQYWQRRIAAALFCVLLVRSQSSGYQVYCVDAPGLVFGLFALLSLSHRRYWIAATCAAAAAACKQTLISVALAELIWLFVAVSPRAAWCQLGRCLAVGFAMAVIAVSCVGGPGLWHTMVELPGRLPWTEPAARIRDCASYLLIYVALPCAVMIIWRDFFFRRNSPLILPSIAFLCALPLGMVGFLKIGGNVNSLHSFWLWFPPCLAALTTGKFFDRLGDQGSLVLAMGTVAVASVWLQISDLSVLPRVQAYREATYLAARLPEKIWFPLNPLITLYSDGRFYHDLDGLCERSTAGQPLTDEHFAAHIPRTRQASATLLPVGWGLWGSTEGRLPKDTPVRAFGMWRIDGYLE